MALSFKFPIVSDRVIFGSSGVASEETRARAFADMTKADIASIDEANARALGDRIRHDLTVDGAPTEDIYAATTSSEIVARWRIGVGAVKFIWDALHSAGPYKTGAYRSSATMYADGASITSPDEALGAREVLFLPLVPYARKIERGNKGYAPGKVYEAIAAEAKARFSNAATIKFTYAEPDDSRQAASAAIMRGSKRNALAAKNARQPAIIVFLGD